jgi:hypothetical protein
MKAAGNINWSQEKNQYHYVCTHPANKQKTTTNYSQMFFKFFFWTLGLCEDLLSFVAIFTNKASTTQQQPKLFWTHLLSVFPLLVVVVLFLTISRNSCRPWVEEHCRAVWLAPGSTTTTTTT